MKIPKKIDPCPIIESIVEIRFDSDLPADAVFGIAYTALKNEYPKVEKLPILQVPEIIRSKEQQFWFKPHYQLSNENFLFQIGPKVFSVNNINEYAGWDTFRERILATLRRISELEIVNDVSRLGIRYINYFDFDIMNNISLSMQLYDKAFDTKNVTIRAEIDAGKFLNVLQIANNAEISFRNQLKKGSVIDIDTVYTAKIDNFFEIMEELIEEGHLEEKKLFFSLLRKDYLETLNPEY
jgi:uncharacterized protein (TIGR04255 family)